MLVAFFEKRDYILAKLRDWIGSYTLKHCLECDVLYFSRRRADKVLGKYASGIAFAFISLDDEGSRIGLTLSRLNPSCYICYYSTEKWDLKEQLLYSRPFGILCWDEKDGSLDAVMDAMLSEFALSTAKYSHSTKRGLRFYPIKNILYFQSELKYVYVKELYNTDDRESPGELDNKIFAKLSEVEQELVEQCLSYYFVRVHKSFIVNMLHIISVDKQRHSIEMSTHENLPISEAYYKPVLERLRLFNSPIQHLYTTKQNG